MDDDGSGTEPPVRGDGSTPVRPRLAGADRTGTDRSIPPSDVCVLIPTLNEASTIGDVIDGFREQGYENVLVVDGDSDDETREIARNRGARVVVQSGDGKGQAVREAMDHVDVPYVLMLDGDGTYDPADADRMLEPLALGYDHVIGDRFADMDVDAMTRLNGVGNRVINGAFRYIHGAEYDDILSGYRAFTADSFDRLSLSADGFTIETELAVECVKHGVETTVVPISYAARPDDSDTNLHPIRDGGNILVTLYALAKTNNPLFYFGSIGTGAILAGAVVAVYVLARWVWYDTGHNILALVSAAAILLGVQLVVFGVLSDMIVALHREQRRRLERIARESVRPPREGSARVRDGRTDGVEAEDGSHAGADDAPAGETNEGPSSDTDEDGASREEVPTTVEERSQED